VGMLLAPSSMSFMVPEVAAQEKETVCSAFDRLCDEEPEHYVERYITEPEYKAWFDRNFPDYTIYEGIGITESQYQEIVNDLTKPQPGVDLAQVDLAQVDLDQVSLGGSPETSMSWLQLLLLAEASALFSS